MQLDGLHNQKLRGITDAFHQLWVENTNLGQTLQKLVFEVPGCLSCFSDQRFFVGDSVCRVAPIARTELCL
ncbi:hypothetical protein D3C76_1872950 [compost metagenome]